MKRIPLILLLAAQLTTAGLAQQPPQQATPAQTGTKQPSRASDDDVVKITTNLVQVDAIITDKNGKLIRDLRQDEVQIFEDGREQKITNFSFVTTDAPAPDPGQPAPTARADKTRPPLPPVRIRPENVRRTIALVVDDLGLSFTSMVDVRRALKKFVDEQMQTGDLVAILRTSGGIGALQQFTADKRQLYAAIERVKWNVNGRSGISPFAPMQDNSRQSESLQEANQEFDELREDTFAVGTLGAVGYVVQGMRELPGRKSVLLMSDGFRIYTRGESRRNERTLLALRRLLDQANRATVVIYTMNASGLQTLSLTAADATGGMNPRQIDNQLTSRRTFAFESQDGLDYLAEETGGFPIRNTNDLSSGIRRVMEDQKSYYLIGYRPDESTFDKKTGLRTFHKLSLKVTRSGKFNVRMRNGFFGFSDDEVQAVAISPRQQILNALTSPFGSAGVHMRLTTLFANDAKVGSYMRSLLHINADDLTFTDLPNGEHKAEFDVVAVTFGDNGNVVDEVSRTYTIKRSGDDYERLRRDGFVYFLTVPIKKAGAYQLRTALRDHASQHVGSASQFIEVPDVKKNRLLVSGILVTATDATMKKASAETGGAAAAQNSDPDEEAPKTSSSRSAATRQFKRGQSLQYSFVIYNARLDKTTSQPQLRIQLRLFLDGKPFYTGPETPFDPGNQPDLKRLAVGGAIQLNSQIPAGEYVFQVTVTDPLADEKHQVATQWMDFEIVK